MTFASPRITEQLENILELLKKIDQETTDRITSLEQTLKKPKENKYKYQSLINYLKDQGKETSDHIGTSKDKECLTSEEILVVLQDIVQQDRQQKCLTKEDLESFFAKKPSKLINLAPPFRG